MSKMRHWKQRFDIGAELVFRKRMKLGCCGVEMVHPGDLLTQEMKVKFGRHRLRTWWESGFIEIGDFVDNNAEREARATKAKEDKNQKNAELDAKRQSLRRSKEADEMRHVGAGWYEVTIDGDMQRVRGKEKAEALLEG